eukprot:2128570-Rhodomonas_salina.1
MVAAECDQNVRGLMLKCLGPPPNPNSDLSRSGVMAAGSKCTTLPGVISPRLSGAGLGARRSNSSLISSRVRWRSAAMV